jgi:sortase A
MIRRWLRRLLAALGCLLILTGVGYGGAIAYMSWREQTTPSTQQVLLLRDGRQIPLVQPSSAPADRPARSALPTPDDTEPATTPPSPTPESAATPILPPLRIAIPKIGVDWPVVLSDNEHLPEFRGVGWLMGSSFPGAPGNMVLYGHLGGEHGTFMRLHELQPGDEFSIFTESHELRYRVRATHETTPDDVGVLVPTEYASATLITCSGPWDPIGRTNERRLIVSADYLAQ